MFRKVRIQKSHFLFTICFIALSLSVSCTKSTSTEQMSGDNSSAENKLIKGTSVESRKHEYPPCVHMGEYVNLDSLKEKYQRWATSTYLPSDNRYKNAVPPKTYGTYGFYILEKTDVVSGKLLVELPPNLPRWDYYNDYERPIAVHLFQPDAKIWGQVIADSLNTNWLRTEGIFSESDEYLVYQLDSCNYLTVFLDQNIIQSLKLSFIESTLDSSSKVELALDPLHIPYTRRNEPAE